MEYENVLTEADGDLLIVTLHWPERHNALSHRMRVDLLDCARRAETDDTVKAIVFTGHGDKSFSAGANIPELEQRTLVSEMGPSATLRKDLPTAIERLGKPTVAAINGYCLGAGLELAMGCTVRIAADNALLGQPEITLGQIPGSGGTQRLYRFVGLGWAMQMVLTGQHIDARTAASIGLVTEVVPQAGLLRRAKELARELGSRAPMAFVAGRDAVLRSTETDLNAWMVAEGWAFAYRRYSHAYVAEESRAQAERRGIWRGEAVAPWEWRKGRRLAGASAAEQGKVGRCVIKGNIGRSGKRIYHVPGGQYYERTRISTSRGERWFCSEGGARAAGWRRSRQ